MKQKRINTKRRTNGTKCDRCGNPTGVLESFYLDGCVKRVRLWRADGVEAAAEAGTRA